MSKIYKGHNSKVTFTPCNQLTLCNCRVKGEYLTDGKCETVDVVYHCRVTSPKPQKIYFGLAEGKWKQGIITIKIQSQTTFTWDDTFKLCVTSEGNFRCNSLPEMFNSEVHHTLLKHLKNLSFVFA